LLLCFVSGGGLEFSGGNSLAQDAAKPAAKEKGGIVTFYALDPLAHKFSFGSGKYGGVFQNRRVVNGGSDIDFNNYKAGGFSVGVEGGRLGTIIDLGTGADLEKAYGFAETVGGGQGFASIHRSRMKIVIRKGDNANSFQPLKEADSLFGEGKAGANAAVRLGHIYLIRLTDRNDKAFERLVKFLVISYREGESVTIRWQVLQ
jgi:hypothetical protein